MHFFFHFNNIMECVAVEHNLQTDTEVILFIKMKDKMQFDETLNQTIRLEIKSNLSPKHVPSKIFAAIKLSSSSIALFKSPLAT